MNQFWRASAVTGIALFLETCGFYLLFKLVVGVLQVAGGALPFWLVMLTLVWSYLFSFYVQTVKFSMNLRGMLGLGLSLVSLLALVNLNTNLGMLAVGKVVSGDWNTAVLVALTFVFLLALWWRGAGMAHDEITLDTMRNSFLWSLAVVFLAALIDSLSSLEVVNGFLIVGFFGVGLSGLSLTRFAMEGGESAGVSREWLIPILVSVGAVLLLGLLLSGLGLGGLDDVTRALLGLVGAIGLWVLKPFLLALGHLAALLVQFGNWLSALMGGGDLSGLELAQSQIRQFHESLEQVEDGGPPKLLVALLKWIAFLVVATLAGWLLFRLFRFRKYLRGPAEVEETRESLFSWTRANNDLSGLLAGWWDRLMQATGRDAHRRIDPQNPREVYHSFLLLAGEMGLGKQEWQTPKEHQDTVRGYMPPAPVARIVDEFQFWHYGHGQPDGTKMQVLLQDWATIRQVVERYRQDAVA